MKREKGITLIALVITIIVLLILAGVSISLVIGNNGILNQATNAVDKHREATAEEEIAMAWASCEADYWSAWANNSSVSKKDFFEGNNGNKGLASYLNGIGTVTSFSYSDEGESEISYKSNTSASSTAAEYIIDENGKVSAEGNGNAEEIKNDNSSIGAKVNYTPGDTSIYSGEWQILYADSSNVYIITKGALTASNLTTPATGSTYAGTSDFETLDTTKFPAVNDGWLNKIYGTEWTSSNPNMKATEYLLDSTVEKWAGLKSNKAKWVIGGPTLEMLVASYNAVNTSSPVTIGDLNEYGYPQTIGSGLTNTDSRPWNHGTNYWLACPSRADYIVRFVNADSARVYNNYYYISYAFRPVVCLKSSVKLTKNASGAYDIDS